MELLNPRQLFETITKAQKILIPLPSKPNGDALGSALALNQFLSKLNKEVAIVCEDAVASNLSFLPGFEQVKKTIDLPKNFVISVSTAQAKLEELSYRAFADKVNIYLKPKNGNYSDKDVTFGEDVSPYDLIICIDTPSLEQLGELYAKNADIFFQTTKINIDNHIDNENYGNINCVDVTASSTAEILLRLLKEYEVNLIDQSIATALLTGIIFETNSFQHTSTTPQAFLSASELIGYGADQQAIIRFLFKTKEFSVLKLWGRAMARIATLPEFGAIYSVLTLQDIQRSGASEQDVFKVMQEFVVNVSDFKLLFLIVERNSDLDLYVHSNPNIKLDEVVNFFGGKVIATQIGKAALHNQNINNANSILIEALGKLKSRVGL